MGVRPTAGGIRLVFLNEAGNASGQPDVVGEFAFLFSRPRPIAHGSPNLQYGSQDWFTDVVVVDNPAKLTTMELVDTKINNTSASSMMVRVQWSVDGDVGRIENCVTIAIGAEDFAASGEKRFYAHTIRVLPSGTDVNEKHLQRSAWENGVPFPH